MPPAPSPPSPHGVLVAPAHCESPVLPQAPPLPQLAACPQLASVIVVRGVRKRPSPCEPRRPCHLMRMPGAEQSAQGGGPVTTAQGCWVAEGKVLGWPSPLGRSGVTSSTLSLLVGAWISASIKFAKDQANENILPQHTATSHTSSNDIFGPTYMKESEFGKLAAGLHYRSTQDMQQRLFPGSDPWLRSARTALSTGSLTGQGRGDSPTPQLLLATAHAAAADLVGQLTRLPTVRLPLTLMAL